MKVITIKQPWATLIAEEYKEYEFRSWKTKYRGPLLIHAGKGIDKKCLKNFENLGLEYPSSRIIALVELEDCILVDEKVQNELSNKTIYGLKNYIGSYAWKLSNIRKINNDRDIKGQLGLWNIEL